MYVLYSHAYSTIHLYVLDILHMYDTFEIYIMYMHTYTYTQASNLQPFPLNPVYTVPHKLL